MEFYREIILALIALITGSLGEVLPDTEITVPAHTRYGTVLEVIDGDTIVVDIEGTREFVRYIGIDTPERENETNEKECFSDEATAANNTLVSGKLVRLIADEEDRDTYNRLLRYVYVNDELVQERLLEEGFARLLTIPPNTRHKNSFSELERIAIEKERGLWKVCV